MFGIFRFYLALLVVSRHLIHVPNVGEYAVSGFFVLSGYLMTLIMNQSYGYTRVGLRRFWVNRALRLYPTYFAILMISLIIIFYVGEKNAEQYQSNLILPQNFSEIFFNISMIYPNFIPSEYPVRLSPTTWALTVELGFYLLISLGFSKNIYVTVAWFVVSIIYTFYFVFITTDGSFDRNNLYYSLFAGSLPFSVGALLYYAKKPHLRRLSDAAAFLVVATMVSLIAVNAILSAFMVSIGAPEIVQTASFILNIAFSALCVYVLAGVSCSERVKALDKWLGDLSYPIYLIHIQVGLLVAYVLMETPATGRTGLAFFVFTLATALSIGLAVLFARLIDAPIETIRARVREKPATSTQGTS